MPVAFTERGPFSIDTFTLTSTTATDTPSNRTFTLSNADFNPLLPETLEVTINGVKLQGTGSQVGASATGDEFYIDNATNPSTVTIETNARLAAVTASAVTTLGSGDILKIRRLSNRASTNVDYAPGSVIREVDLDNSNTQVIHVAQEAIDIALSGMTLDDDLKFNANDGTADRVIKNVAVPVAANDVVTKTYLEDTWLTSTDKTNSATVAGISADVTTVATAPVPDNLNTLVNHYDGTTATSGTTKNLALLNTVALRNSEIGLLGTSAMGHATTGHLALLANADVREDMALLTASGVIDDMALLGATGVIEDMAQLTATGVVADMALLAGNSASGNTVIEDMNTLATSDIVADLNTLAESDIVADLAAIGATGVIGDIETVADNLTNVNNFADTYQIDDFSPTPTTDGGGNALAAGDLVFDTTANQMKVWDGSAFGVMGLTQANATTTANNAAVAMAIALG
tara:strand:+ start:3614 stop:4999 length:1386 start_codon:yes stop_codon:yes gene_type:complete